MKTSGPMIVMSVRRRRGDPAERLGVEQRQQCDEAFAQWPVVGCDERVDQFVLLSAWLDGGRGQWCPGEASPGHDSSTGFDGD